MCKARMGPTNPHWFPPGFDSYTDWRNHCEVRRAVRTLELRRIPVGLREEAAPPLRHLEDSPVLCYDAAAGAITLALDGDPPVLLTCTDCGDLLAACVRALLGAGVPADVVRAKAEAALGAWRSVNEG
jgi:hypothetical protein